MEERKEGKKEVRKFMGSPCGETRHVLNKCLTELLFDEYHGSEPTFQGYNPKQGDESSCP